MRRSLAVLHVAQPAEAGVPQCVAALAADQVARGWDVTVAAPEGVSLSPGVTHRVWHASRAPGPATPGETARVARIVRDARPDVVHLHSSKAGLAGRLAVRGRVPTVFSPHAWSFAA